MGYQNCKCRKKLVDKLVEEFTETFEEVKLAKRTSAENENVCKCSSCMSVVWVRNNDIAWQNWRFWRNWSW